jgi:uncharacterized protein (DUF4415 family)
MATKKRKRVSKGKGRKIARLHASVEEELSPRSMKDWQGYFKPIKKPVTLRVDADVLAWFQRQGPGYQTRINRALRKVMAAEMKK